MQYRLRCRINLEPILRTRKGESANNKAGESANNKAGESANNIAGESNYRLKTWKKSVSINLCDGKMIESAIATLESPLHGRRRCKA